MPESAPLPVTERTRHRRLREQGSTDAKDLEDILRAGVICHLGVVVDGYPMVLPTVYGLAGDTVYLHGSVASRSLVTAPGTTVYVTVTHVFPAGILLLPHIAAFAHRPAGILPLS